MIRWVRLSAIALMVVLSGLAEENLVQPKTSAELTATPAEQLKVAKDFKVELLYSVPEGRAGLVGQPVRRSRRAGSSSPTSTAGSSASRRRRSAASRRRPRSRRSPSPIGEAQGLLWAFDSLYVVVNGGEKYASGLYRVTRHRTATTSSTRSSCSAQLEGGGEHGPHAVLLAPGRQVAVRRLRQPDAS